MFQVLFVFFALFAIAFGQGCSPNNVVQLAQATASLSTLVSALTSANLVNTVQTSGPITVFAPTNLAFNNSGLPLSTLTTAQLTDILTYHVLGTASVNSSQLAASQVVVMLNGANATITKDATSVRVNNYATVSTADINACNGVVHIINKVLIPPCFPTAGRNGILLDAVATAQSVPTLSSLVARVVQAGLVPVLQSAGPFTIFAPSNAAFTAANLPSTLTNSQLSTLLLYHVVNGRILSSDLSATQTVTTVSGGTITITVSPSGTVTINGARSTATVTTANVQSCNAVVHLIDAVLLNSHAVAAATPLFVLIIMMMVGLLF